MGVHETLSGQLSMIRPHQLHARTCLGNTRQNQNKKIENKQTNMKTTTVLRNNTPKAVNTSLKQEKGGGGI